MSHVKIWCREVFLQCALSSLFCFPIPPSALGREKDHSFLIATLFFSSKFVCGVEK